MAKRPDHSSKATDLFGTGKHGYRGGSHATQTGATGVTASALNNLTEEQVRVVERQTTLDGNLYSQLSSAIYGSIDALAAGNLRESVSTVTLAQGAASDLEKTICIARGDSTDQVYTSTDGGVTFAAQTLDGGSTNQIRAIVSAFDGVSDKFLVVGEGGEIQASSDGLTWDQKTPDSGFAGAFYSAAYSAALTRYVITGTSGMIQTAESNPNTWTERTQALYANTIRSVARNDVVGQFVACGIGASNIVMRSSNGITWTECTIPSPNVYVSVHAVPDGFVVLGDASNAWFSRDAITWTHSACTLVPDAISVAPSTGWISGGTLLGGSLWLAPSYATSAPRMVLHTAASRRRIFERTNIAWVAALADGTVYTSPLLAY